MGIHHGQTHLTDGGLWLQPFVNCKLLWLLATTAYPPLLTNQPTHILDSVPLMSVLLTAYQPKLSKHQAPLVHQAPRKPSRTWNQTHPTTRSTQPPTTTRWSPEPNHWGASRSTASSPPWAPRRAVPALRCVAWASAMLRWPTRRWSHGVEPRAGALGLVGLGDLQLAEVEVADVLAWCSWFWKVDHGDVWEELIHGSWRIVKNQPFLSLINTTSLLYHQDSDLNVVEQTSITMVHVTSYRYEPKVYTPDTWRSEALDTWYLM